ncbi:hypothetical protein T4C_1982 [Trichinella pseudospiralis]|uniref:Uncharacterized protein n=2 Tax=Trichinella pseudospiralis TaxID=6337 RepID=A0A0V1JQ12_TRIPS|nr:hypothetical protein T4C_1982 [Trichinella pseudospiralis]
MIQLKQIDQGKKFIFTKDQEKQMQIKKDLTNIISCLWKKDVQFRNKQQYVKYCENWTMLKGRIFHVKVKNILIKFINATKTVQQCFNNLSITIHILNKKIRRNCLTIKHREQEQEHSPMERDD